MDDIKRLLAKATIRMLRPLVRILMRYDISHGEFAEMAKQAYVDVAYNHFSIPSRKTTYSRVSVLTGLSRKEVMRLSKTDEENIPFTKGAHNRTSRVISGWLRDAAFLDENNKPKTLPLRGGENSFEALVARYGGDIPMGAILDELERINAISKPDQHTVALSSHGYIPEENEPQKLDIMSVCTSDLLGTVLHNLDHNGEQARFQRQVVYRYIPESIAEEFKQYSNEKSLALLLDYNRWLDQKQKQASDEAKESVKRIGVGIYYFENKN